MGKEEFLLRLKTAYDKRDLIDQGNFPSTIEQLQQFCFEHLALNNRFSYYPGMNFPSNQFGTQWESYKKDNKQIFINGEYGLRMVSVKDNPGTVIAYGGFTINPLKRDEMVITHTAQSAFQAKSKRPDKHLSQELKGPTYRISMIEAMIAIARSLGLKSVKGIAAINHEKVRTGVFTQEQGEERMDDIYKVLGFIQTTSDNNYYLILQ